MTPASTAPIELEIVASSQPRLVQALRELWAYRGTILAFAVRDIRVKYKQAVLGVAWALAHGSPGVRSGPLVPSAQAAQAPCAARRWRGGP